MAGKPLTEVFGDLPPMSDLRLVLLGRVGAGKSVVANAILGRENFKSDGGMCVKKQGEVAGRTVTVVDTPGWDRVSMTSTSTLVKQEIERSVTLSPPGPHALLLVVPMAQLSSSETKTIQHHVDLLSDRAWKYAMVLFVRDSEEKCTSIEEVRDSAESLLEKCGGRHHVLECGAWNTRTQVSKLLQKIEEMVAENSDQFLIPQVYYELMETKMPREVTEPRRMNEGGDMYYREVTELRRINEGGDMYYREVTLKEKSKRKFKEMEEELNMYKKEDVAEKRVRKRRGSSEIFHPNMSTEEEDRLGKMKATPDNPRVDLAAIRQGYREEAVAMLRHYVKPVMVIVIATMGALLGSIAGSQFGTLGSCLGIVIGIGVAILVYYVVHEAARAARYCFNPVQEGGNEMPPKSRTLLHVAS